MSAQTAVRPRPHPAEEKEQWHPVLYPAWDLAARAAVSALRARLHPERVVDTLGEQLRELAQARNPAVRLEGHALAEAVDVCRNGAAPDAFGVWVHYPWSRRLVRVLPQAEFRELRLCRNRNKITAAEQAELLRLRLGIVGLSVGQASAVTMAMEGIGGEFLLADFDTLSLSNMNRVRAGVHDIGVNKAVLTARALFEIDPFLLVSVYPGGIREDNIDRFLDGGRPLDILIEECDDLPLKLRLRERARALRIPVLMETSDRGMLDVERFDLEPDRPILHGRVEGVDANGLQQLSREDRVSVAMRIVGAETLSPRAAASALEVGATLESWPQLASAISLGAALNTDAVRRIALGTFRSSGRYYVDLEQIVADAAATVPAREQRMEASVASPSAAAGAVARIDQSVRDIVASAISAPSGGNAQPWRFTWNGRRLRVHLDPARSTSLLDHGRRASLLAIGAAAENALLTAGALGVSLDMDPFPEGDDSLVVCDLHFSELRRACVVDPLHAFVPHRCTNRRLGNGDRLPQDVVARLTAAAQASGATLRLIEEPAHRARLGEVLGKGDRWRFLCHPLHAEFVRELRWTVEEAERTGDGIDLRTLEMGPTEIAGLRLCSSWLAMETVAAVGGGRNLEKFAQRAAAGTSAFGVLSIGGTSERDYFQGGGALQRVWLTATQLGLGFQPMAALSYVAMKAGAGEGPWSAEQRRSLAEIEARYRELVPLPEGHGELLLFRLSKVDSPTVRALRRPVDAVLAAD